MRIAYGYNRAENDFARGEVDEVLLDYKDTNRRERAEWFGSALRPGDTLARIDKADLGRGGEVSMLLEKLDEMGVSVEIIPYDAPPKQKPGPQSNFQPGGKQAEYLQKLWHNVVYSGPYVQRKVCDMAGWSRDKSDLDRARNWLNNRFGSRVQGRKK